MNPIFTFEGVLSCNNVKFLRGTKFPTIIIIFSKTSMSFWNCRKQVCISSFNFSKNSQITHPDIKISNIDSSRIFNIAIAYTNGNLSLWNVDLSNFKVKKIEIRGNLLDISSFCLDLDIIISGSEKGNISIWDVKKNNFIKKFKAHSCKIKKMKIIKIKKKSFFITQGNENKLKFWSSSKFLCYKVFRIQKNVSFDFKILPNPKFILIILSSGKILFYKIDASLNLKFILKYEAKSISSNIIPKFVYKKRCLILADSKICKIKFISIHKKKIQLSSTKNFKNIHYINHFDIFENFLSENFFFLTGFNSKNKITIFEVDTQYVQFKTRYLIRKYITVSNILNCCEIKSLHWLNDNNYLISLCGSKKRIFFWSISNKKIIKQIKTISKSNCMKILDEQLIIIGTKLGRLEIYEFNLEKPVVSVMEHNGTIWCIDIFIEKFKIITTGSDKNLIIWIINEKKIIPIKKIQLLEQTTFIKTLSSKKMIFVSVTSGSVIIFCSETLEYKKQINCHSLPVLSIEISISLNLLITGSSDSSIGIWDLNFLYQKKLITDKNEGITSLALNNCVKNLVSGTRNGTIKVWNLFSYSLIAQYFFIHQGPVWTIVTSNNCKYLASGSSDSSIVIWRFYPSDKMSLDENTILKNNLLDPTIIKSDNKNNNFSHNNFFKNKSSRFKFTKLILEYPNKLLLHIVNKAKKNHKVLPKHFDLKTTILLLKEVIKKNNKIKTNPEFRFIKKKIKNKISKELLDTKKLLELINNLR